MGCPSASQQHRMQSCVVVYSRPDALLQSNTGMLQAIDSAPAHYWEHLQTLAHIFGINVLLENATFFYAHGVFEMRMDEMLRSQLLDAMAMLMADGGQPALQLCEGFDIPNHCLQAPIAFDWRRI
jgi:acyl-CoA oxidase